MHFDKLRTADLVDNQGRPSGIRILVRVQWKKEEYWYIEIDNQRCMKLYQL